MQITHEEARKLIQFNVDKALRGKEKNILEDHLKSCPECRRYAGKINEVEMILRSTLEKRWNHTPLPLQTNVAASKPSTKLTRNLMLATRIAAMSVLCIAFLFNIWQFTLSTEQRPSPSISVPPVPTPSVYSTTTERVKEECEQLLYRVQENDTLESLAEQFSVSPVEIMDINHISVETLQTNMELVIPVCSRTPTSWPSMVTNTYTPLRELTTSTPINSPTQ